LAYCIVCDFDYKSKIDKCPECGEKLVHRLSSTCAAAVTPDDSWVIVGGVANELKSDVVKGSLDSNNIPSVIFSAGVKNILVQLGINYEKDTFEESDSIIMVPIEYIEEARFILRSVLGEEPFRSESDSPLI